MDSLIPTIEKLLTVYGLKAIAALAIFVFGRWMARLLSNLLRKGMTRAKVDQTLIAFVANLGYFALLTFVVLAALAQLGIQTTSFIAVLGAAGLAVGLALQGSLSNFASGVLMLIFRPFKVGDFIEGAGTSGIVEEIQIFTTQLRTGDNKTIIIPNAKLTGDNIVNYSSKPNRRLDLVIGVGYDSDLVKVKEILKDILASDARVLPEPAPTIGVLELADNSINFAVRPWVKTSDYWALHFDTLETVKARFDAEGINIPFPQRDVHLYYETAPKSA